MYGAPHSAVRPPGLRCRSLPAYTELWRIEGTDPSAWEWAGFPEPRHRFDPALGGFRTRYASSSVSGAARERYLDTGSFIPVDHADHLLIRLTATRRFRVVDLRTEANLLALQVDDRISTGHEPNVWNACHRLVDALRGWWPELDGIVYRSRTTPATSYNVAFFSTEAFTVESRTIRACPEDLNELVLRHRVTVGFDY